MNKEKMKFKVRLRNGIFLNVETERLLPITENYYGNGTYTVVFVNGVEYYYLDTRYKTEFNSNEKYKEFMPVWIGENWKGSEILSEE